MSLAFFNTASILSPTFIEVVWISAAPLDDAVPPVLGALPQAASQRAATAGTMPIRIRSDRMDASSSGRGGRPRGIPGEVTIGPCQPRGLLVGCAAHDGADSVRGLLLLRLPRAGTGPARDGLAPPLPPPPVHRPPSTSTSN